MNYATCGTAQGCRDHDACYDFAAMEPIWGYGGVLIGPMYRACDLEAMCHYSFKTAVGWAMGGGPYDSPRLEYADYSYATPGCLGPCPENTAAPGEAEVMTTCLEDRELWEGIETGDRWEHDFGNHRVFEGFVPLPWIGGVNYGVDARAKAVAEASAKLGPFNLENACLVFDRASGIYTGSADLALHYNIGAKAGITGALDGWLSDVLCLIKWVTVRGSLTAYAGIQLPGDLRARVTLECENGELQVIPDVSMSICPTIFGGMSAGLEFFVLGQRVWGQDWPLLQHAISHCWEVGVTFEPFIVGEQPDFHVDSSGLDLDGILGELFEPAAPHELDLRPPSNPIDDPSVLLPCLNQGDPDPPDQNCPNRATGADGDRLVSSANRQPSFGAVRNLTITSGASAGVASSMAAPFLTPSLGEGTETNDSVQRGIYRQPGLPTKGCYKSGGSKKKKKKGEAKTGYSQSQVYIKGHLLNANVGGFAEERNLFPITGDANDKHKRQVEQHAQHGVVPRVKRGDLIYYTVDVQNISQSREILTTAGASTNLFELSATFHCEVADYQLCPDDTLKRNPIVATDIQSDFVFHPSDGASFDDIWQPCPRT